MTSPANANPTPARRKKDPPGTVYVNAYTWRRCGGFILGGVCHRTRENAFTEVTHRDVASVLKPIALLVIHPKQQTGA